MSAPIIERGAAVKPRYDFACAACAHRAQASVEGADGAEAQALVSLAACPKCGDRSELAWRPLLRARIVPSLAYGFLYGLAAIAGTCVVRHRADPWDVVVGGVVAAVFAIGNFVVPVQKRIGETKRVVFEDDAARDDATKGRT